MNTTDELHASVVSQLRSTPHLRIESPAYEGSDVLRRIARTPPEGSLVLPVLDCTGLPAEDDPMYFLCALLGQSKLSDGQFRTALAHLSNQMVGHDPLWRAETAHLSAAQHDFSAWTQQRVEGVMGTADALTACVDLLCAATKAEQVLLLMDCLDESEWGTVTLRRFFRRLACSPQLRVLATAYGTRNDVSRITM